VVIEKLDCIGTCTVLKSLLTMEPAKIVNGSHFAGAIQMLDNMITAVNVKYQHRDGWHIFTSPEIPGLYIASKDPRSAYEDVPVAVKRLIELDLQCHCEVVRAAPFDSFAHAELRRVPEGNGPLLRDEAFFVRGCLNDSSAGSVEGRA
jgi:hypothetical protein